MPDREDALMDAVKPMVLEAMVDRLVTDADLPELPSGDNAVLAGGKHRDDRIDAVRSQFSSQSAEKCERIGHAADFARSRVTRG